MLGQITEPEREGFWDEDFGVVADAVQAIEDAETLTSPGFWTEECEEVNLAKAFWAWQSIPQDLLASTWATLELDELKYSLNNPNFSLALNSHVPVNEDLIGLWHYDVSVYFQTTARHLMRAVQLPWNVVLAIASSTGSRVTTLSFDTPHLVASNQVRIEVWSLSVETLNAQENSTWFNGHFIAPAT